LEEWWGGRMEEERLASLKELENRLGYRFNEIRWLDQALTHKSYIHQTNTSKEISNEVLEFLGDAVLSLAVGHLLIQKLPEAQEGTLSRKRAHLVKQSTLASLSKEFQLEKHLLLGKGELQNGGMKKSSILANTYEALIGAIYMDSGFPQALVVISRHFEPYLQPETDFPPFDDYKSLLQEYSQGNLGLSPQYRVVQESGPDHDKQFQASVMIGDEVKGIGCGKSKKEAEQEAAKKALEGLQIEDRRLQIERSEI
jgi:ribonuclease III